MKLVLVHGFLGSSMNWGPVLHKLGRLPELANTELETRAPDLLGHGRKAHQPVPSHQAVVEDLTRELPTGDFIALGHSFGLRPLLAQPEPVRQRMRALIAEDATPLISEAGFQDLEYIFKRIPVPFSSREAARSKLEEVFGAGSRMARFLMTNIREDLGTGLHTWRFDAEGLYRVLEQAFHQPLWQEWENYEGLLYAIFGGHSSFVPPERQQELIHRRKNKAIQVYRIPQSGHWVHADQPDLFVSQLGQIILDIQTKLKGLDRP